MDVSVDEETISSRKGWWVVLAIAVIVIFASIPVLAASDKFIIWLNENKTLNGKKITFIGFDENAANFIVDGEYGTVLLNQERLINGMYVTLVGKSSHPAVAIVNITVNITCGDGTCGAFEDHQICCKDCGCLLPSLGCFDNVCVENVSNPTSTYECLADSDCKPGRCQSASCNTKVVPYQCAFAPITNCTAGDGCCPISCSTDQDSDCAEVDKCDVGSDCNDNNPCTDDICEGDPKRCKYNSKVGCILNGECISIGAVRGNTFCSRASIITYQRVNDQVCEEDYECLSGECFAGTCKENRVTTTFFYLFFLFLGVMVIVVISYISAVMARAEKKKKSLEEKQKKKS